MTNPTADAANLLPCPFPWQGDDGSIQQCVDRGHCGCGEKPRPQLAPPAGEPDFNKMADEIRKRWIIATDVAFTPTCDTRAAFKAREAYHLSLAARPKVEDGEVVGACQSLRSAARDSMQRKEYDVKPGNHWLEKIADLLERLASELADLTVDRDEWKQQHENLVDVRQTDIANLAAKIDGLKAELDRRKGDPCTRLHNLCEALQEDLDKSPYTREEWEQVDRETVELQHKLREAEAKLAEREAALAESDEAIAQLINAPEPRAVGYSTAMNRARNRHAARQQQKALDEPTEREGE